MPKLWAAFEKLNQFLQISDSIKFEAIFYNLGLLIVPVYNKLPTHEEVCTHQ